MPNPASHSQSASRAAERRRHWRWPLLGGAALILVIAAFVQCLTPDRYALRLAKPAGVAHEQLAQVLAQHARSYGVTIEWISEPAQQTPLDQVRNGAADVCLVSGAPPLDARLAEVVLLCREAVHVLARPEASAAGVAGLAGRRVNIGVVGTDWTPVVHALLAFAGLRPNADFTPTHLDARRLTETPAAELPDVLITVGGARPVEVERLVRECGYKPVALPFAAGLAKLDPNFQPCELPAGLYSVIPPVPAEPTPTVSVGLRLVARKDASAAAVKRLLEALFDGAFARTAGLPFLDERALGQDRQMTLHAGAAAFLHRNDPLLTPGLLEETEDLRNFLAAAGFGGLLLWRWAARRRSRLALEATAQVHRLERDALRMEADGEIDAGRIARLRRDLARVKARLVEHMGHERFADEFFADLLARIDGLRHSLLMLAAHHRHLPPPARGAEASEETRAASLATAGDFSPM